MNPALPGGRLTPSRGTFTPVERERSFADWARHLDNRVLGRPVPDERPLWEQVQRPRPAVWSTRGRLVAVGLLIGMLALAGNDSIFAIVLFVALFAGFLVVIAADERKRARLYYEGSHASDDAAQARQARLPGRDGSGAWMRPGSRPFWFYWGAIAAMLVITVVVAATAGGWWVAVPVLSGLAVEYAIDRRFRRRSDA